jgi:hypothetical protein
MRRAALALGLPLLLAASPPAALLALASPAALLALASPAAAKEVSSAEVCGANGCHAVKDRALLAALPDGGPPAPPPTHPSGWYRATLTISAEGARDRFAVAVLPVSRYIRGRGELGARYTWMHMSDRTARAYRRIARGLEPFPAATLRGLHQRPIAARVDEVVGPPADPRRSSGFPWLWTLLGIGAVAAAGGIVALRRGATPRPAES